MSAILHITHGPAYAVAEISALAFAESVEPVLRGISEQTRKHGDRRLLVNLLDVVGTFGPEEQRTIGVLAHQHLSHLEKVASLVLIPESASSPERSTKLPPKALAYFFVVAALAAASAPPDPPAAPLPGGFALDSLQPREQGMVRPADQGPRLRKQPPLVRGGRHGAFHL